MNQNYLIGKQIQEIQKLQKRVELCQRGTSELKQKIKDNDHFISSLSKQISIVAKHQNIDISILSQDINLDQIDSITINKEIKNQVQKIGNFKLNMPSPLQIRMDLFSQDKSINIKKLPYMNFLQDIDLQQYPLYKQSLKMKELNQKQNLISGYLQISTKNKFYKMRDEAIIALNQSMKKNLEMATVEYPEYFLHLVNLQNIYNYHNLQEMSYYRTIKGFINRIAVILEPKRVNFERLIELQAVSVKQYTGESVYILQMEAQRQYKRGSRSSSSSSNSSSSESSGSSRVGRKYNDKGNNYQMSSERKKYNQQSQQKRIQKRDRSSSSNSSDSRKKSDSSSNSSSSSSQSKSHQYNSSSSFTSN